MERVKILRLGRLPNIQFQQIREAQQEGARVWNQCRDLHLQARRNRTPWPGKIDLQVATKGRYALHSQTVQMICHGFIANIKTTKKLRKEHPKMKMKYPWRDKEFRPLIWPRQAVSYEDGRILLPMGRGKKSLVLKVELPEDFGSCKIVWNSGYELHVCYGSSKAEPLTQLQKSTQATACVDLGEIHQAAVVTDHGSALIVSGRGIRALKQGRARAYGQLQSRLSLCIPGSRRQKKLAHTKNRLSTRVERRIRDLRHKGTRKVVDFCRQEGVTEVFVGNPHGVRKKNCGRKHNQRMSGWEYGVDIRYIKEKCEQTSMKSFTGSERGTSSQCPSCGYRQKVRGRQWRCRSCLFSGHRDCVGGTNMFPLAFGKKVTFPARITYLRAGSVRKQAGIKSPPVEARSSRADSPLRLTRSLLSIFGQRSSTAQVAGFVRNSPNSRL